MAVPLSGIHDPRWTKPALVLGGGVLHIVSDGTIRSDMTILLEGDGEAIPIEVEGTTSKGGYLLRTCAVPEDIPDRLYDLTIIKGDRRCTSSNSVCVLSQFKDEFTFLHATDLHLIVGGGDGELIDRSDYARALVSRINGFRPDFVLYTGDLVSRYGAHQAILSPDLIRWQARRVQEIMLGLEVPVFVTIGNHDVAFESSRAAWRAYMGWPWCRPTDDYSFDYGDCHFTGLDCFVHYDGDTHQVQGRSFTPEQLIWLGRDLHAASSSRWRFLFFHYDYGSQLKTFFEGVEIHMALYGHSKKIGPDRIGTIDDRNANLSSKQYRLVRVERETISSTVFQFQV